MAHWNPAATSKIPDWSVTAQHNSWLEDLRYEYIGAARPIWEKSVVALSCSYLHMDAIETRDDQGTLTGGRFKPYSLLSTVNFSHNLSPNWSAGINYKYIQEVIEGARAGAYAFDLGLHYDVVPDRVALGVAVQNLGPKAGFVIKDFHLPLAIRGGVAFSPINRLTLTGDVVKCRDNDLYAAAGCEFALLPQLPLRAGYSFNRDLENGFAAGVGFSWQELILDYAFAPHEELGDLHRFTISWQPGRPQPIPEPRPQRPARQVYIPSPVPGAPPARETVRSTPVYQERTVAPAPVTRGYGGQPTTGWQREYVVKPTAPATHLDQAEAHYRAEQYLDRGEFAAACRIYHQIIEYDADDLRALTNLADAYYRLGDQGQADYYLERALAIGGM